MATKLDVRQLIPMERHRLIFETYGNLKSGEAFERVNDHDPKRCIISSTPNTMASSDGNTWNRVRRLGAWRSDVPGAK